MWRGAPLHPSGHHTTVEHRHELSPCTAFNVCSTDICKCANGSWKHNQLCCFTFWMTFSLHMVFALTVISFQRRFSSITWRNDCENFNQYYNIKDNLTGAWRYNLYSVSATECGLLPGEGICARQTGHRSDSRSQSSIMRWDGAGLTS